MNTPYNNKPELQPSFGERVATMFEHVNALSNAELSETEEQEIKQEVLSLLSSVPDRAGTAQLLSARVIDFLQASLRGSPMYSEASSDLPPMLPIELGQKLRLIQVCGYMSSVLQNELTPEN